MKQSERDLKTDNLQSERRGRPGSLLRRRLQEVASRTCRQRLGAGLLPFLILGTAATALGWGLSFFTTFGPAPWLATLTTWIVAFLVFLLPSMRRLDSARAAVVLDREAGQSDRFCSALSFLENAGQSGMEQLTLQRAEQKLRQLNLSVLFPVKISRVIIPLALISLTLTGHSLWSRGTVSDLPGEVSGSEHSRQQLLDELQSVIPEGDEVLEELLRDVEETDSLEEMVALIDEMRERLGSSGIDGAMLAADLEQLTDDLDSDNQFAAALSAEEFEELADALRQASQGDDPGAQGLKEFLENLPAAESMAQKQTRELLEDLQDARRALQEGDQSEVAEKLQSAAERLEEMGQQKKAQEKNQAAAKAVEGLQDQLQEQGQTPVDSPPENAGGGSLSSGGTNASPSEAPAEEASDGQAMGSSGSASSPGPEGEEAADARTPIEARFEVEFGRARSLVREHSGAKTRDLPSLQVQAVRAPSDGRIIATQEFEEALSITQIPLKLREQIQNYLLAINDGNPDN